MPEKNIGVEVEYPKTQRGGEQMVTKGVRTRDEQNMLNDEGWRPDNGRLVYDGSVGIEVVSEVMTPKSAKGWYAEVIQQLEDDWAIPHEPCGKMTDSTAGMHIHMSPLNPEEARLLRRWSEEPWMQVFACTSVSGGSDEDYSVFRGGRYCQLGNPLDGGRYSVVNDRGGGHYEWRLPEPMTAGHFDHFTTFLDKFFDDPKRAKKYALEVLDDEATDAITSVQRAERVGVGAEPNIEVMERGADETASLYDTLRQANLTPVMVTLHDGVYYGFRESHNDVAIVGDMMFSAEDVFDAFEGDRVHGAARSRVNEILNNDGRDPRESRATPLLKDVTKKKKGELDETLFSADSVAEQPEQPEQQRISDTVLTFDGEATY